MPNFTVTLLLRVKTPDGKRPYLQPARSASGKVRPGWGLYKGQSIHYPDGVYALRFTQGKRLVFETVGADVAVALIQQRKRQNRLEAVTLGNAVQEETPTAPVRVSISEAIQGYLDDIAARKSLKTSDSYRWVLQEFRQVSQKEFLDELGRSDMISYILYMKQRGLAGRTQHNHIANLDCFLRKSGLPRLLEKAQWPRYVEKINKAYSPAEVASLMAVADPETRLAIQFLVGTGLREREFMFATWRDLDFADNVFTVTAKPDLGFTPKDFEERQIPIPDDLVKALQARRNANPQDRLIFTNQSGTGPEGHWLRRVKETALRGGLNCRDCVNKQGLSCAEHPVCDKWELHAFRKTFATMHCDAGVSARTLQAWLGHSDLETTCAYLKVNDLRSERTRTAVNRNVRGAVPAPPTFGRIIRLAKT